MAKIVTNRDRLDRIVDYFRKATRYWWLVGGLVVLGGVAATWFAQSRPRKYQSWSVVFYQERIQSTVLRGGSEQSLRNIGDRYRELLLSQTLLSKIIDEPKLNPFPELEKKQGKDAAVDALRLNVSLQSRGNSAFRIAVIDEDPVRAQAIADKLTVLLNEKDDQLRSVLAQKTAEFAAEQEEDAKSELTRRRRALTEFLAKHPEFVQDTAASAEGSGIRASQQQSRTPTPVNSRLASLQRQRDRITARLNAKPGEVVPIAEPPSPERVAAQQAVNEAERELAAAKRDLEEKLSRLTDLHPNVVQAKDRVANAQNKLRQAQAAVPPASTVVSPPATAEDRAALQRQLKTLEEQIASAQSATGRTPTRSQDAAAEAIVELETQYAELRRAASEQDSRAAEASAAAFRAQQQASQQAAEQGGRLAVVDPAFRPIKPHGSGKSVLILAGLVVFGAIGGALALGLALIDDRLYRRDDIDELGLTVLAVVPAARAVSKKKAKKTFRGQGRAATTPPKDLSS
jgi:uncharacterized protein involved in exopolysaccharide biosynthesis